MFRRLRPLPVSASRAPCRPDSLHGPDHKFAMSPPRRLIDRATTRDAEVKSPLFYDVAEKRRRNKSKTEQAKKKKTHNHPDIHLSGTAVDHGTSPRRSPDPVSKINSHNQLYLTLPHKRPRGRARGYFELSALIAAREVRTAPAPTNGGGHEARPGLSPRARAVEKSRSTT